MTDRCSIQANPDIAGILSPYLLMSVLSVQTWHVGVGTRIAFYLQSVIVLLTTAVSTSEVLRGGSDPGETDLRKMIRKNQRAMSISFIALGFLLVISASIQRLTFGLSVYHAFIVLGLIWMTVFTAMPAYFNLGPYRNGE